MEKLLRIEKLNINKSEFINKIISHIDNQQDQTLVYLATDVDEQGDEIAFDLADYLTNNAAKKDALIFKRINLNSITRAEVANKISQETKLVTLDQLHQKSKPSRFRRIRNAIIANHYVGLGAFGLGTVSASILKTIKDGTFIIGEMNLVIKTDKGNFKTNIEITMNNFNVWEKRRQQLSKLNFSLESKMIETKTLFDDLQNFNDLIIKL